MSAKALLSASVSAPPAIYVEDVFSTYLYTGTNSTQTITNGIDLAGEGWLVWIKVRDGGYGHVIYDTNRGVRKPLQTNLTNAQATAPSGYGLTAFTASGFTLGASWQSENYGSVASWTFRKAAKFFDVVTYTGNDTTQAISHSLGSVPGCIIVKRVSGTGHWRTYHRSRSGEYANLDLTNAFTSIGAESVFGDNSTAVAPTSTQFTVGNESGVNANGSTYVAYLFAHDAGGFGDAGTDSVVSCGSFSGTGFVNLGWEPQWIMIKPYSQTYDWQIYDNMRGMAQPDGVDSGRALRPNTPDAESGASSISFEATGFTQDTFGGSYPCIYIAIRRGPMKTPTVGTEVFAPVTSQSATGTKLTTGFPVDMQVQKIRSQGGDNYLVSRLTGVGTLAASGEKYLITNSTAAEASASLLTRNWDNTGYETPSGWNNFSTAYWSFRRAPGFFDVVAYTGTGASTQNVSHNLGVVPEMIIVKSRSSSGTYWMVYHPALGKNGTFPNYITLNEDQAKYSGASSGFAADPTSSVFTVGAAGDW